MTIRLEVRELGGGGGDVPRLSFFAVGFLRVALCTVGAFFGRAFLFGGRVDRGA